MLARFERDEPFVPWWAPFIKLTEDAIGLVPAFADTRKGRSNARQLRIGLMVLGVMIIAFGQRTGWIILGALMMMSAVVIPMAQLRKRTLLGRLKAQRTSQTRRIKSEGRVTFDGRRVQLIEGDKKLRQVLTGKGDLRLELRQRKGLPCLGVVPKSSKKREAIWICATGDVQAQSVTPGDLDELAREEVDTPAFVEPDDWASLYDLLTAELQTS